MKVMATKYILLDSDDKIERQCNIWDNYTKLSVDFEGEFNLHVYGEHLCLVQIYDGKAFYIIDPRSKDVTKTGLERFFSLSAEKLWFDCQSDSALVYKKYGLKIKNIKDLRVYAKTLGFQGNLISLEKEFLGIDVKINKKKNQQANWLRRPIEPENLEYALLDVAYLMELEPVLEEEIDRRKLRKNAEKAMKSATTVKEPEPGWKRIGPWRLYDSYQKILIKHLYISRDAIGKRFNVPASRVLDKESMTRIVMTKNISESDIEMILSKANPRFKSFLSPLVHDSMKKAKEEYEEQRKAK